MQENIDKKLIRGLNILLIGPYPPPFGGIASHLVTLIPGLQQRGVGNIAVIKFESTDNLKKIDNVNIYSFRVKSYFWRLINPVNWKFLFVAFFSLPVSKLGLRLVLTEATKSYLIGEVARIHKSTVLSYYQVDHSISILICSKIWKKSKAFVLTVFGEVYDEISFFKKANGIISKILDSAQTLVSSSCHCARGYKKFLKNREVEAVYYGVDLDRFKSSNSASQFRSEMKLSENDILLFFMGRFSSLMGLDRLLEIMPEIFDEYSNTYFLIAGANGPLSNDVTEFQNKYSNRVKVLTEVPFSLQPALYGAADIILTPSRDQHACMGMSIKEAMASSKVVIGSNAGGIPEAILPNETGLLVPLDASMNVNTIELKNAIVALIGDPSVRISMGEKARKRAEEMFSMDITIDRMMNIFYSAYKTLKIKS